MSREIKFRAFDKWNKKITFDLYDEPGDIQVTNINGFLSDNSQYEFMQFTGLIDKNGVEIYEGDIIIHGVVKAKSSVIFKEGSFALNNEKSRHDTCVRHYGLDECEVIGNIYENPEQLSTI